MNKNRQRDIYWFSKYKKIEILVLRKRFVQSSVIIIADNKTDKSVCGEKCRSVFSIQKNEKNLSEKRTQTVHCIYRYMFFFHTIHNHKNSLPLLSRLSYF